MSARGAPTVLAWRIAAFVIATCAPGFDVKAAAPEPVVAQGAHIEVYKSKRELQVFSGSTLVWTYRIGLGLDPVSAKRRQGDRATPEGRYFISHKNPRSRYFLALGVSYPNGDDARRGLREGSITRTQYDAILRAERVRRAPPADTALGGDVFVHGRGSGSDWTWGCIALDDADMRELYDAVAVGTPVTIHP